MAAKRVLSVNVGQPQEIEWLGHPLVTSIWKQPVEGRLAARGVNIAGDDQADRGVHGGEHKAIYVYAREDQSWWESQLGRPIDVGGFGENLTLEGVDVTGAVIGERWAIGSAVVEVSQARIPCVKLGARMGDKDFPIRFREALRPGAYLRIVAEGDLGAGDEVALISRPDHGITIRQVFSIYRTRPSEAGVLLRATELTPRWRDWAHDQVSQSVH